MNRVTSDGIDVKSQLQAQIKRNAALEVSIVVLSNQDMLLVTEQRSKHYLAKLDAMCFTLMKLEKAPQLPEIPGASWRNFLPFGSASPIKGSASPSVDDLAEVRNENRALLDVIAAQNLKIESLELREHSLSTDLRRPQDEEREKREAELRKKVEVLESQVIVAETESSQLLRKLTEVKSLVETETHRRGLVQAECAAKAELLGQTVSAMVSRVRRQLNFINAAKNYRWKSFMRFHCIYHIVHYMGVSNQTLSPQKCSLLRWWLDVSCFLSPEDLQAMPQGSEATTVWKQLLTFEDIVDVIPQAVRSFLQELDHHSLTVSVNLQKLQMMPHVDGPGAALMALTVVHSTSANTDKVEAFLVPLFQSFIDDLEANFETDQARYWADCISVLDSLVTSATLYSRSEASTEFWMQAFVDKLRSVHDLHKQKLVSVENSHEQVREELSLAVSEATKQLRLCEERLKRSKEQVADLECQIRSLQDEKDGLSAELTVMDSKTSTLQQQFIKLVGELGQTNLALSEVVSLLCAECTATISVKAEHASLKERFQVVPFVVWCLAVAPYPVAGPEPGVHHKPPPKSNPQAVTLGGKVVEDTAALKEGLAVEATAEKAAEAAAAAAKAEQAEGARQAEEVKAALGNLLSGSEGEGTPLLGPDGKPLLGPDGKPLLGPGKPLLGPDGKPLLGPDGKPLLGPGGTPLLGPDGKPLLGPDGKPLLGPGGTDLGRLSSLPPVSDFKSQVLLSAVVSLLLAPTAWCIFVSDDPTQRPLHNATVVGQLVFLLSILRFHLVSPLISETVCLLLSFVVGGLFWTNTRIAIFLGILYPAWLSVALVLLALSCFLPFSFSPFLVGLVALTTAYLAMSSVGSLAGSLGASYLSAGFCLYLWHVYQQNFRLDSLSLDFMNFPIRALTSPLKPAMVTLDFLGSLVLVFTLTAAGLAIQVTRRRQVKDQVV